MEPASKKRRLAPKADSYSIAGSHHRSQSHQNYYQNERQEFEAFARHLQDAAMQIQRQTEPQPYTEASVLLLSWQDDDAAFNHVSAVDQVFQSHFGYRTQRWSIPTYANPSLKLGVRLASFLQTSEPNQLLIVYYAGHGFVGTDGQVYWARDSKPDAARLKWNGLRCIFEDAAPDVLLLLDTCFVPQPDVTGSNGTKQIITSPAIHGGAPGMFTPYLVEALRRLSVEGAFTAKELHDEVCARIKAVSPSSVQPIFVNLARDSYKDLVLTRATTPSQNGAHANGRGSNKQTDVNLEAAAQLRFDEARVLVCTTFVGDGNANMEHFNFWVQHTPPLADVITLEAMFLGPPTMLLISMPTSVWNVVQHDKVCIFLGYISSHNMLDMYEKLLGSHKVPSPSPRRVEEEMISPTAHEARDYRDYRDHHDPRDHRDPRGHRDHREHREYYDSREQREHREYRDYRDSVTHSPEVRRDDKHQVPRVQHYDRMMPSPPQAGVAKREDAPESPEITEAAEQLKSLSHTRHRSSEHHHSNGSRKSLPGGLPTPSQSHHHPPEGTTHESGLSTPGTHTLDFPNKHDVRCNHCSHLPFKDISSLRKHIAAAHTRPFPCAFSFAGCNSTFGSKNEWKRHIASQHLCLQYYRCSACPYNPNSPDSRGNEFNRKDLFTQHLRRMHAPLQIKRAGANGDAKVQAEWDAQVKDMQHSCLVTRRKPPQQSACPKPGCGIVFDGASAWDDWTEHVGRHMEKGEGDSIAPDGLLIAWALREGIVDRRDGIYKLVAEQRSPAQ